MNKLQQRFESVAKARGQGAQPKACATLPQLELKLIKLELKPIELHLEPISELNFIEPPQIDDLLRNH